MAIYQTTADVMGELLNSSKLEKEYTGEEAVGVEKNLINGTIETWGTLIFPDAGITSPSVSVYPPVESLQEEALVLPPRLIDPQYGSVELEGNLQKLAEKAPGIKRVWEITKGLPSLTDFLSEERENE